MTVPLVVGMPVYRRAWCMERWFDSFEAQDPPDGTRLVFALSPSDDSTEQIIRRRAPDATILDVESLPTFGDLDREAPTRYTVLAVIRNRLLRTVASLAPERYLSWDSDIILEPYSLQEMLRLDYDAVGWVGDMGGGRMDTFDVGPDRHLSWMNLDGTWAERPSPERAGELLRPARSGPLPFFGDNDTIPRPCDLPYFYANPFQVGVIMGVKLMTPRAYRDVRYADHLLGEDVGWAIQAEAMGVERWVCPRARGEHLYRQPVA